MGYTWLVAPKLWHLNCKPLRSTAHQATWLNTTELYNCQNKLTPRLSNAYQEMDPCTHNQSVAALV